MEYKIRWANINDSKRLGYVHSQTWKTAYKNIVPEKVLNEITPKKREKYFRKAIKNKEETAVLIVDNKVVGFITLGKCRDNDYDSSVGEIWGIYILSAYWRKGLGRSLINWGVDELANRGYKKITLWVLKDNKNSRKFYEKMGFINDGSEEIIKLGKNLEKIRYIKDV